MGQRQERHDNKNIPRHQLSLAPGWQGSCHSCAQESVTDQLLLEPNRFYYHFWIAMSSRITTLQAMPVFGGLQESVISLIIDHARRVSLDTDVYFFREGEQATSLFVLDEGRVGVFKNWRGAEHLLCEISSGECFGEMAIMDMLPRSASVRALEPCTAIEISTENLSEIYELDNDQFTMIQMNLGREVSRRLRKNDELLFRLLMGDDVTGEPGAIIST